MDIKKYKIEELENILNGNNPPIKILPNGELTIDFKKCAFYKKCWPSELNIQQLKTEIVKFLHAWDSAPGNHNLFEYCNDIVEDIRQLLPEIKSIA